MRKIYAKIPEETIRYVIAGVCSTGVDFFFFAIMTWLGVNDRTANGLSITFAILFAYFINKLYVFKKQTTGAGSLALEFLKFVTGRGLTALLEYFGYPAMLYLLGNKLISKGFIIGIVFVLNYLISKLFVFRKD